MFRIFMLWILIVSLPLRGIAAEIARPCMMAHAIASDSGGGAMDGCDDPEMMPMDQLPTSTHASTAAAHQDAPCHENSLLKHSSCRVCCACHAGASAPPSLPVLGPGAGYAAEYYVYPISSFTGWVPARIERPPRA